jgi:glycosyltransferase involved in cell wall biosynthesis
MDRDSYRKQPLVSIVTPVYNMANFLEETIQSVLAQDYPFLEYIVMDGGSTDGTLEILKRYEGQLQYISRADRGQCDAINQGFRQSRGEIFAFLCADDKYLPGAVSTAVQHMLERPGFAGVYGDAYLINARGEIICPYPTREFNPALLQEECFICQPASFLWRETFAEVGMMDPQLHYGLDYEFWIRLAQTREMLRIPGYLAASRMHYGSKTLANRRAVFRSSIRILKRYYGYIPFPVVYGYCCSLLDARDGFFEPVPPSLAKYLLACGYGSIQNWRHLLRFWADRLSAGLDAVRRFRAAKKTQA